MTPVLQALLARARNEARHADTSTGLIVRLLADAVETLAAQVTEIETAAGLLDPAHDDRFRPCPECDGEGVLGDGPLHVCGVCCGDGWLWKHPEMSARRRDGDQRYIDHSAVAHSCGRCAAPTPAVAS